MKTRNRLWALLLSLALVITYTPAMAFAEAVGAETNRITFDDSNSGKDIRDVHIHGNIGVLTSQAMLTSEVNLIKDNLLDLIDYIADDWHAEFCMMIYV